MSEPRILKKYPNRRLYDLGLKRYITLSDVHKLVMKRVPFVVRDHQTRKDVTALVLLQAIVERHQSGRPALSRRFLEQVIRRGSR